MGRPVCDAAPEDVPAMSPHSGDPTCTLVTAAHLAWGAAHLLTGHSQWPGAVSAPPEVIQFPKPACSCANESEDPLTSMEETCIYQLIQPTFRNDSQSMQAVKFQAIL